jgi:hypothetical protein
LVWEVTNNLGLLYTDKWGTPFQYLSEGSTYILKSYGQDGIEGEGNDKFDSDIIFIDGEFTTQEHADKTLKSIKTAEIEMQRIAKRNHS